MPKTLSLADATPQVQALHTEVDAAVAPLVTEHAARLRCGRGCTACCTDDLTVFEVEAALIRQHHPTLLAEEAPHPAGACAFLAEDGACRIYPHRPYVCRTQGLPLRWEEEDDEDGGVEYRDICPLNEGEEVGAPPLEELDASSFWTLGPAEARLATLQAAVDGGLLRRVPLRDLFRR